MSTNDNFLDSEIQYAEFGAVMTEFLGTEERTVPTIPTTEADFDGPLGRSEVEKIVANTLELSVPNLNWLTATPDTLLDFLRQQVALKHFPKDAAYINERLTVFADALINPFFNTYKQERQKAVEPVYSDMYEDLTAFEFWEMVADSNKIKYMISPKYTEYKLQDAAWRLLDLPSDQLKRFSQGTAAFAQYLKAQEKK